ncbi:Hsp20/alpha crystallin family protein [Methanobrevibacter sp. DSM 116169]|uniref:Hsp20/alpha crystallin family protein n=1 Tax=Methanobrevibacter sp. DSM 116169 TaxID=3242727 RepID=UPI0038FC9621
MAENTNENNTFEEEETMNDETINEKVEKGKKFANQAANDLGKGFDDLILNLKTAQKSIDGKINEYKQNTMNTLDVDLIEDSEKYYLKVAVPGVKKESIDIEMTEIAIFISCEFESFVNQIKNLNDDYNVLLRSIQSGKCKREINFTTEVDVDNVKARYENGLVFIEIPKVEIKTYKVNVE